MILLLLLITTAREQFPACFSSLLWGSTCFSNVLAMLENCRDRISTPSLCLYGERRMRNNPRGSITTQIHDRKQDKRSGNCMPFSLVKRKAVWIGGKAVQQCKMLWTCHGYCCNRVLNINNGVMLVLWHWVLFDCDHNIHNCR